MPPRRAARRGSTKKATPKPKPEETRSSAIEEEIVATETVVAVKEEEVSVTTTVVVKEESKLTEEIVEDKNLEIDDSSVAEEIVVEESKGAEEIVEEKRLEIDASSAAEELKGAEEIVEEKRLEIDASSAAEESKVTEEKLGEKKLEIEGSSAAEDVVVEESKVAEEIVEEKELEIDGSSAAEKDVVMGENEDEENSETDNDQYEPEEDGTQVVVEGEESAVEVTVGGGDVNCNTNDNEGGNSEGEENESGTDDDSEDDEDLSSYMQLAPLKDKKKQTGVQIFVGGLNRKAVEKDLIEVFGEFGEIKEVRIVKNPVTLRSKGYAFISYATAEQTNKVLADLKDGIEIKGKHAGISPSQDGDTLYMGNICKAWTKEKVLETLKGYGIGQIEEIYLPEDMKSEGKIRGFGYLEFCTHSDAMAAFQRLRKPDAIFGLHRSAKVAFAPSMHPSEEALSEVKTVYVEGLTDSWDEEKLEQLCNQYGQVEQVQLSRDLVTVKRVDFGFVSFTLRKHALACVEGINNAQIGEDVKVKASLAKPQYRGRLGKNARGGYRVRKDGEKVEETGKLNAKGGAEAKGAKQKAKAPPRSESARGGKRPQGRTVERTAASKEKEQSAKGTKRDRRGTNSGPSGRPSKKPRGNVHGRPINGSGNQGKSFLSGNGRQTHTYDRRQTHTYDRSQTHTYHSAPAVYADPYARGYSASALSYQGHAYGAVSDMEPHAGYLSSATMSQSRDPYDYRLRRVGGYLTQGSGATSYAGGSMLPPSYAPGYTPQAAYESGSASRYVYPSRGTYLHRRPYY